MNRTRKISITLNSLGYLKTKQKKSAGKMNQIETEVWVQNPEKPGFLKWAKKCKKHSTVSA
jgi:hypothetical protein